MKNIYFSINYNQSTRLEAWERLMGFYKIVILVVSVLFHVRVMADNTLIYPISLHYFKGQYYIGDRGRDALLSVKAKKPRAQTKDNEFTVPLDLSDNQLNRLLITDLGPCNIKAFDLKTGAFSSFSSPPEGQGCPRFVTRYAPQSYAYTNKEGIAILDNQGNQIQHKAFTELNPFGIAPFKMENKETAFAIANPAHRIIYVLKYPSLKPTVPLCHGTQLKFPYDVVNVNNKLYFDDVILNALFEYDVKTKQCIKLPYPFVKPMGLAVAGTKIGIIDAGKRALIEYSPKTKRFNTLYQDTSPLTHLVSPWDVHVSNKTVYVSDRKRGAILKISKRSPHVMRIFSDAAHGEGPPFLTVYDMASNEKTNRLFVSDASSDLILQLDKKTGNRRIFSESVRNKGIKLGDVTTMTLHKDTLYAADWSNSAIITIDASGNRKRLLKLDSPPFAISNVLNREIFVTQVKDKAISKITLGYSKAKKLKLNCPDLILPFGIIAWDKETLVVSDKGHASINRIVLKTNRCQQIATIPTESNQSVWLIKRYDKHHVIVSLSNSPRLYLVNYGTGKVQRFI